MTMNGEDTHAKMDRLLGKVDAFMVLQSEQGREISAIGERVAKVEAGVRATRDIVQAWGAAKTLSRFVKWAAGIAAALLGLAAAIKGVNRP